jgi:phage tail sheath protein FI
MAERIVSPGVFTRENDLSFLTQGISEIGGAFIGPTPKGPAFIPTIVRSQQEYVTRFGDADANHYTGLTVKNYLKESGVATVVRVLGLEGYSGSDVTPALLYVSGSATGKKLLAVLHPTQTGDSITTATAVGDSTSSFSLLISGSETATHVSKSALSVSSNSDAFFGDYLGYTAEGRSLSPSGKTPAYLYAFFPDALTITTESLIVTAETSSTALSFPSTPYTNASTPWIQSQEIGGTNIDLFKIHTLSDGVSSNKEIKVSISNVKKTPDATLTPYGTFSLTVRKYDDTDTRVQVLEQYDNLTLDPDSPQYIARVIGNSAPTEDSVTLEMYYQGDFPNNSQYIRIEMVEGDIPETALPMGFGAVSSPFSVSSSEIVSPNFITSRWKLGTAFGYNTESVDTKYFYGWDFTSVGGTNESYLAPIPSGSFAVPGTAFTIEGLPDVPKATAPFSESISLNNPAHLQYRRFTVSFQGGFDGLNPARDISLGNAITETNTQGFNLQTSLSSGTKAYIKAINAISNPDNFDFNLLAIPGVIRRLHPAVADYALELCENRGDAFYIMDTTAWNDDLTTAVGQAQGLNTSYAATYYPWVRVLDSNSNKLMWVPPSAVMPEVYAFNDNAAAEWFAPAGLNRGGIPSAVGVKTRVPQASRDTLYEGKVNPIVQFPGQGIVVWGQKTLQTQSSALDRVNVRRLLIAVKKYIASSARYLVFEQNIEATRNRFLNIVNPYLASIQERSGLFAFRVVMDETNNTPDVIDRNILYGQLYLQPTRTAEFIILDFNVLPTGATFPTA